jgi:argininosuccinate synthase
VPSGLDPDTLPTSVLYHRTSEPAACQALPATVELTFERSLPVAVNGIAMPFVEIVEVVETIAGDHGIGRSDMPLGSGVREITEAPAAVTLGLALAEIERTTLAPRLAALKASLSQVYAAAIDDGAWFSTSRSALDAFVEAASAGVSGVVRVQLFQGECRVAESGAPAGVESSISSVEAGL